MRSFPKKNYDKLILTVSKNSPHKFYNYATFIDILQSGCHYIILEVLVWQLHFDYKLDTLRLDTTEYTEIN